MRLKQPIEDSLKSFSAAMRVSFTEEAVKVGPDLLSAGTSRRDAVGLCSPGRSIVTLLPFPLLLAS